MAISVRYWKQCNFSERHGILVGESLLGVGSLFCGCCLSYLCNLTPSIEVSFCGSPPASWQVLLTKPMSGGHGLRWGCFWIQKRWLKIGRKITGFLENHSGDAYEWLDYRLTVVKDNWLLYLDVHRTINTSGTLDYIRIPNWQRNWWSSAVILRL